MCGSRAPRVQPQSDRGALAFLDSAGWRASKADLWLAGDGISGDVDTAVHAAMNVVEPVLDARDTEILRLRRLMGGKLPGR